MIIVLAFITKNFLQDTYLLLLYLIYGGEVYLLIDRRLQSIDKGIFQDLQDGEYNIGLGIINFTLKGYLRSKSIF